MKLKQYLILFIGLLLVPMLSIQVCAETITSTASTPTGVTEGELVSALLQNPKVMFATMIQFLLGFALGYVSVKIVKYVIAFIIVIALGSILSIWSLGGSIEDLLANTSQYTQQLIPIIKGLLITLGIFTVGPVSAGFVAGLIVGFMKK